MCSISISATNIQLFGFIFFSDQFFWVLSFGLIVSTFMRKQKFSGMKQSGKCTDFVTSIAQILKVLSANRRYLILTHLILLASI